MQLQSRRDAAELLLSILRPLKPFYSSGGAWLHIGNTAAHYGEKNARMEGFARILWGLGPLWAQEERNLPEELREEGEWWLALYRRGIIHGTDPAHEEYWGDLTDYDQKMVEMAAIVTAICLNRQKLWDPLTDLQKENLFRWLWQINEHEVHANNWRFFRILVNMTLRLLGQEWSEARSAEDWEQMESCYRGKGWYSDGEETRIDYYIPFAMHFYSLIYAHFAGEQDPERAELLKKRGDEFARDYIYWFDSQGNEIPMGRSLTYRFAHGAFFSALALAGRPGPGYGVLKTLALRNLERWMERPIFDPAGILTIGYGYPNLFMSETYNAPGSPYWGLKTFLMLALPEGHPFWTAPEQEPSYEPLKLLPEARMLISHTEDGHALAYTAGLKFMEDECLRAKYGKLAYSNRFAFSVPRGAGLTEGAFDSVLALSAAGENRYQIHRSVDAFRVTEQAVYSRYRIGSLARVASVVIPLGSWHVRVHEIEALVPVDAADGGFAIRSEKCFEAEPGAGTGRFQKEMVRQTENALYADFPWGISGVVSLSGAGPMLVNAAPNTNLLYPSTVIPTVTKRLEPGRHRLISCVLGDLSEKRGDYAARCPEVTATDGGIRVRFFAGTGWEEKEIAVEGAEL